MHAIRWGAVFTMFVVIVIYDQLLFRPLVAWAEKFKSAQFANEKAAESWVINLFRRTRMLRNLGKKIANLYSLFVNMRFSPAPEATVTYSYSRKKGFKYWGVNSDVVMVAAGIAAVGFNDLRRRDQYFTE